MVRVLLPPPPPDPPRLEPVAVTGAVPGPLHRRGVGLRARRARDVIVVTTVVVVAAAPAGPRAAPGAAPVRAPRRPLSSVPPAAPAPVVAWARVVPRAALTPSPICPPASRPRPPESLRRAARKVGPRRSAVRGRAAGPAASGARLSNGGGGALFSRAMPRAPGAGWAGARGAPANRQPRARARAPPPPRRLRACSPSTGAGVSRETRGGGGGALSPGAIQAGRTFSPAGRPGCAGTGGDAGPRRPSPAGRETPLAGKRGPETPRAAEPRPRAPPAPDCRRRVRGVSGGGSSPFGGPTRHEPETNGGHQASTSYERSRDNIGGVHFFVEDPRTRPKTKEFRINSSTD